MAYNLTNKAVEDVLHIYSEGLELFGQDLTEAYYTKLEFTFQLLADNPKLARQRLELNPPVRIHPFQSHLIIYQIDDNDDVLIIRVRHNREDWETPLLGDDE